MASKKNMRQVKNYRGRVEKNFNILYSCLDIIDGAFLESAALQRRNYFRQLRTDSLTQKEIKGTTKEIREWRNGAFLFQVENYSQKKEEEEIVLSDTFYSSQHGHRIRVELDFEEKSPHLIFCSLLLCDCHKSLLSGFHFRVTFSVVDQSDRNEKRDIILINESRFGMSINELMSNSWGVYINITKEYIKNNSIQLKVIVEPLSLLFKNYFSRDGILLWTIDNYRRTKQEAVDCINQFVYSDYFYSSQRGFRMQAQLQWWCCDYIRFYLCFMVGENDADLTLSQLCKCTLSIINQNNDRGEKEIVIGTETINVALIANEKLARLAMRGKSHLLMRIASKIFEKEPFLINDRAIFKITIEFFQYHQHISFE